MKRAINQNEEDFQSKTQVLKSFKENFKNYAFSSKEEVHAELKDYFSEKPDSDTLFVGSEFLSLYSHSREEDLSDKFAWLLNFSFVRDAVKRLEIREKFLEKVLNCSKNYVSNINSTPLLKFSNSLEIKLEVSLSRTRSDGKRPRLDILLIDHQKKNVLGIEIKAGDKNLNKSEEDFECLKQEFPEYQADFILIIPDAQLQYYFNNDDLLDEANSAASAKLPNIKICTWENLIFSLRELHDSHPDQQMFILMSQMFIGSLEAEERILGFNLAKIRKILEQGIGNISDIIVVSKYLTYRKKKSEI
jgi:hypothetical protein